MGKLVRFQYSAATVSPRHKKSGTSPNTDYFTHSRAGLKFLCLHLSLYLKAPKFCSKAGFFCINFMKKYINKKIILIASFLLVFLGIFFLNYHTVPKTITPTIELNYTNTLAGSLSVYDFMTKLQNEGKIKFTEKNYAGIGKFILSINGVEGNSKMTWIYYVNGKEAQVGVSDYKITSGDIVSWKYEKSI